MVSITQEQFSKAVLWGALKGGPTAKQTTLAHVLPLFAGHTHLKGTSYLKQLLNNTEEGTTALKLCARTRGITTDGVIFSIKDAAKKVATTKVPGQQAMIARFIDLYLKLKEEPKPTAAKTRQYRTLGQSGARKVLKAFRTGKATVKELAEKFKVSEKTINTVIQGKSYTPTVASKRRYKRKPTVRKPAETPAVVPVLVENGPAIKNGEVHVHLVVNGAEVRMSGTVEGVLTALKKLQ
jgi:hypothetical protein